MRLVFSVDAVDVLDEPHEEFLVEQIGLLDRVEERIGRPVLAAPALVALFGFDDGRRRLAGHHAPGRVGPEIDIALHQLGLGLHHELGLVGDVIPHLPEFRRRIEGIGLGQDGLALERLLHHLRHQLLRRQRGLHEVPRQLVEGLQVQLGRFGPGSGLVALLVVLLLPGH